MAGNKNGALKARNTNIEKYGKDYYKKIGAKSWSKERSHVTGFALIEKEKHLEISRKGGQVTKEAYKAHKNSLSTGTGE